jgi:hypothetical protein
LGSELLGCGVRERVVFVLEVGMALLEGAQRRAHGADILVSVYLVGGVGA